MDYSRKQNGILANIHVHMYIFTVATPGVFCWLPALAESGTQSVAAGLDAADCKEQATKQRTCTYILHVYIPSTMYFYMRFR